MRVNVTVKQPEMTVLLIQGVYKRGLLVFNILRSILPVPTHQILELMTNNAGQSRAHYPTRHWDL